MVKPSVTANCRRVKTTRRLAYDAFASPPRSTLIARTLDVLMPPLCLLCDAIALPGTGLCAPCQRFEFRPNASCPRCDATMPVAAICGSCRRTPPVFDGVVAPFAYRPPVVTRIRDLKFAGRIDLVEAAGLTMATAIRQRGQPPDVIVPIALHPSRRAQRGFDQSLELARVIGKSLRLPVHRSGLVRVRATAAQTTVRASQRSANVRGAFAWRGNEVGPSVALVDDVMTSGATANAAARCLRAAGARSISVWLLARA